MSDWNYAAWAEQAALGNLKQRLETGDVLLNQANTLLTLLLAGVGGSLALALQPLRAEGLAALSIAAGAVALWFSGIGSVLVWKCIATRETQMLHNEPANLYNPDWLQQYTPEQIVGSELTNLQQRIQATKRRNGSAAQWLDRCRFAAVATPLVFGLALVLSISAFGLEPASGQATCVQGQAAVSAGQTLSNEAP